MSSGCNPLSNASKDADQTMSTAPAGSPVAPCGYAPTRDTTVSPDQTHWISIELVDENGHAVPSEDYKITLPDGTSVEGCLDTHGRAKISGIDSGNCGVSFPNRDSKDWRHA